MNILFNEHRSFDDWGLKLLHVNISFPEIKGKEISLPGMDGTIDLSEVLSEDVNYENRVLQYTFDTTNSPAEWSLLVSKIANAIHGKRVKIVNEFDKSYYYDGRAAISEEKSNYYQSKLVITANVSPFKYEQEDGIKPWLWDSFSFVDGIIREYGGLLVDGSLTVTIAGRRKRVIPVITCSAPMTLVYKNQSLQLKAGSTKVYELQLGEGEHKLIFTGTGTVSICYRGGSL